MKITFNCPHCKAQIKADSDTVGDRLQCPACAELVLVPAQGLAPGATVGGFRIDRRLGGGGMGDVYLATQVAMDRKVALKVLHPGVTANAVMVDRFIHEVKMAAQLAHPNIVTAFDAGQADGYYYLAMSFVDGHDLNTRLKQGPLDETEAVAIAIEVAKALGYAWKKHQMLHRDIKPANIMLDEAGEVKLMDLGIAKRMSEDVNLTMQGSLIGTPYYMSPEQATDSTGLDCRADIYSLGATLYHLLTGRCPFGGTNAMAVVAKHLSEALTPPKEVRHDLSPACNDLICRMMAKSRLERPRDWDALLDELQRVLEQSKARAALGSTIIVGPNRPSSQIRDKLRAAGGTAAGAAAPAAGPAARPRALPRAVLAAGVLALAVAAGLGYVYRERLLGPAPVAPDPEQAAPGRGPRTDSAVAGPVTGPPRAPDPGSTGPGLLPRAGSNPQPVATFDINQWEPDDQSPEQRRCRELLRAMQAAVQRVEGLETKWAPALDEWRQFNDHRLALDGLLKESKRRELALRPAAERETGLVRNALIGVGGRYVKNVCDAAEQQLREGEFTADSEKAVKTNLAQLDEFFKSYEKALGFSEPSLQRWDQKRAELAKLLDEKKTAAEKVAWMLGRLEDERRKLAGLQERWTTAGASDPATLTAVTEQLRKFMDPQVGPKVEQPATDLARAAGQLAEKWALAAALRAEREKLARTALPVMFATREEKADLLAAGDGLAQKLRDSGPRLGSGKFVADEGQALAGFREAVDRVPIEDPWMKHERAGREAVARALAALRNGEAAKPALADALASLDLALRHGMSEKQPGAGFLGLLPPNTPEAAVCQLAAALINPKLQLERVAFADAEALARWPEPDRIWFRRYPQRLTVAPGRSGTAGLSLVLVPPGGQGELQVPRPFYLCQFELSVGEFRRFSKDVLGQAAFADDFAPVTGIAYVHAVRFCNWLSERCGGLAPAYKCAAAEPEKAALDEWSRNADGTGFALPTEAEWTRAFLYPGSPGTAFYRGGRDRPLNRDELGLPDVKPNALGLYALAGNMAELLSDLAGAALKREVIVGGSVAGAAPAPGRNGRQEIYPDDERRTVGCRLALPVAP